MKMPEPDRTAEMMSRQLNQLVRLVDALLRTDTTYRSPEDRKPRKELTRPHSARPAKHSRTRPVPATR